VKSENVDVYNNLFEFNCETNNLACNVNHTLIPS